MCKPSLWTLCVGIALVTPSIAFAAGTYHHAEWVPMKSAGTIVQSKHPVKHLAQGTPKPAYKKIAAHKPATRTVVAHKPIPKPAVSASDQIATTRDQTP
jgi:hypothetical protein